MGGTPCKSPSNTNKPITIAILGLDNAGKTTTAKVLEKESVDFIAPTMGYSQSEINHEKGKIKLIDLGGGKNFRDVWHHYYDDAHGFVYVLDSSEPDRINENRDVLKRLLQEDKVKGKPILILANKQDREDALDKNTILEDLKIERLVNENQTLCSVKMCSAKSIRGKGKSMKIDEQIRLGFDWLIKTIYEHYETLQKRVDSDMRARTEKEEREKRERQERVKKLREAREKEEGGKHESEDEAEDTIKQGFVPIGQAVKNAERNIPEKPPKGKANGETTPSRPVPAPRSSSHNRKPLADPSSDAEERPRRHSHDRSPRARESPISRSQSSRFDDDDSNHSNDEQQPVRPTIGKKKKLIGPPRSRLNGDNLPPLAPSSAASRREDFAVSKGPPVGTPRPSGVVAQWAITSPSPHPGAEKLTSIASDNELDADTDRHRAPKPAPRLQSPHVNARNRVQQEKVKTSSGLNDDDDDEDHPKQSSRSKTKDHMEGDTSERSSARKVLSRFDVNDDDDDQDGPVNNELKSVQSKDRDRSARQRQDADLSGRRVSSVTRRSNGDTPSRNRRFDQNDDDEEIR